MDISRPGGLEEFVCGEAIGRLATSRQEERENLPETPVPSGYTMMESVLYSHGKVGRAWKEPSFMQPEFAEPPPKKIMFGGPFFRVNPKP